MIKKVYLLAILTITLVSCKSGKHADLGDGLFAGIKTNKGEIILKLEQEKTPVTVANFVSLAEGDSPFVSDDLKGKKYYDGLIFHRVIKDFMIQGGDPLGNGSGNPGYKFMDEIHDSLTHSKKGILSMANSGPKTNGSQFFITHKETPFLNGKHTVFGEVVKGIEVVDSIAVTETSKPGDKPVEDIVMQTVEIIRNGKEAKKFNAVEVMTKYFADEEAKIAAFEKMIKDFAGEIITQKEKATELPSGLKILELKKGSGEKPTIGQKVNVFYAGYFTDGKLFDSNVEEIAKKYNKYDQRRAQGGGYNAVPMDYSPDAQLIPGFKEGLMNMNIGDKVRLFIPYHLGYGEQNYGPIPGKSELIFDLEITSVVE